MSGLPPPPDGDQNRGPALLAAFWTPFPITVMLIFTRLYVRISMRNLGPDEVVNALKYNMIAQPFGVMAIALGKASVAFLVLRLIGPITVWRKRFLYGNAMLFMLVSISSCVVMFVGCTPPRALWEPVPGARCWNTRIDVSYGVFQSGKTI